MKPSPLQQPSKSVQPEKDWATVPFEELRKSKASGAADQKIRQSFVESANYNDYNAVGFDHKRVVDKRALRDLSRYQGTLVSNWMKRHQVAIDALNNNHSLTQYHNKRHNKPVTEVISW